MPGLPSRSPGIRRSPVAPTVLATALAAAAPAVAQDCGPAPDAPRHHHIPADAGTVDWGYFSRGL